MPPGSARSRSNGTDGGANLRLGAKMWFSADELRGQVGPGDPNGRTPGWAGRFASKLRRCPKCMDSGGNEERLGPR